MTDGEKKSFVSTGGLVRLEGESDKQFARRRDKAIQQYYGKMSDEERVDAFFTTGGLIRLDHETNEDMKRLEFKLFRRFDPTWTWPEWERHWTMRAESIVRMFEEGDRKERAKKVERVLNALVKEEECKYLIGDLLEEYSQIHPPVKANIWLFKQVTKSILFLTYKVVKKRLASHLGKLIR